LSVFHSLLPLSFFSRIISLPLSYFICNHTSYLYDPLLPSFFFFCGFYSFRFSFFISIIFYLFLTYLLFFVPSYSQNLSLLVMFCILHLSLFPRYLLTFSFLFSYSCLSLLLHRSWLCIRGSEPACLPLTNS
jgi:hypothetical protein